MAENIPMLALSPTMEEGVIIKWVKNEGDAVAQGDVLCEVETDKATMEYESPADGVLLKILAQEGSSVPVGKEIATIGEAGEKAEGAAKETKPEDEKEKKAAKQPAEAEKKPQEPAKAEKAPSPDKEEPQPEPPAEKTQKPRLPEEAPPKQKMMTPAGGGKLVATPLARRLAEECGIDLSTVQGSGPDGRITRDDVEAAVSKTSPLAATAAGKLEDKTIEPSPPVRIRCTCLHIARRRNHENAHKSSCP